MLGDSHVSAQLVASREVLSSIKLVSLITYAMKKHPTTITAFRLTVAVICVFIKIKSIAVRIYVLNILFQVHVNAIFYLLGKI
jgi:hypothetical protein